MLLTGYARYSKKGKSQKKQSYYAPLTITYADGTRKYITEKELKADGSINLKKVKNRDNTSRKISVLK